jgi:hypothetical protein
MPHDLPVTPVTAPASTAIVHPHGEADPTSVPPLSPAPQGHPLPNPSLRLDAGLGMVVLEFRDDNGDVTGTIPSQRVLDAYRTHATPVPGSSDDNAATTPPPERFA